MDIKNLIHQKIEEVKAEIPAPRFNWDDSLYEDTQFLSIDARGRLGEKIVAHILKINKHIVDGADEQTNPERGHDILVDGTIPIEVKLATITVGTGMFQHEALRSQRNYNGILFLDIAPNNFFLTAVKKENIVFALRRGEAEAGLKKLTRRENGDYKCDFSINHIQNNNIPKFRDYKTGEVNTTDDFYNIYKHLLE